MNSICRRLEPLRSFDLGRLMFSTTLASLLLAGTIAFPSPLRYEEGKSWSGRTVIMKKTGTRFFRTGADGTATFSAPQDVTAQVNTSSPPPAGETFKVLEIDVTGQAEGVVYAVDFSDSITVFQFLRKPGLTDAESGTNPQSVLGRAIDKLFAVAAAGS